MLDRFGTVINALGIHVKPYLTQVVSAILWRLNNKSAKVCQQAADLTTRLAVIIKKCGEDQLLSKLGMSQMNPPVRDLCTFDDSSLLTISTLNYTNPAK